MATIEMRLPFSSQYVKVRGCCPGESKDVALQRYYKAQERAWLKRVRRAKTCQQFANLLCEALIKHDGVDRFSAYFDFYGQWRLRHHPQQQQSFLLAGELPTYASRVSFWQRLAEHARQHLAELHPQSEQ